MEPVTTTIQTTEIKHESTLFAEPIAHVGHFSITNALFTSWLVVLVIVGISVALRTRMKKIPGKLQHFFEIVIEGALSIGDQVTNNRKITKKVFPIAICIFFFVLINNWFGLLPLGGFGIIENGFFVPFIRSGTADINTTLALSIVSVLGANVFGILIIGVWKMFNKYVNVKALGTAAKKVRKEPTGVVVAPIQFFVGVIEIIGEVAKVASLSFRLFGNVFAGEVLLASMSALVAVVVPIPFMFLEVIVGIIQAFIFAMLTVVYFTIASQDHDHDDHDTEHHSVESGSHGESDLVVNN